jgi:hypothetical protein
MFKAISLTALVIGFCGSASAHEWYANQKNEIGYGCCGGNDCAGGNWPVHRAEDGIWEVTIRPSSHPYLASQVHRIGDEPITFRLMKDDGTSMGNPGISPDDKTHACMPIANPYTKVNTVQCLFIGGSV